MMNKRSSWAVVLGVAAMCGMAVIGRAADKVVLDEGALAKDRTIHGEYLGTLANGEKWGSQIIALGDGKYRGVGYKGGLPGDGWKRGDEKQDAEGGWKGDEVVLSNDHVVVHVRDGSATIKDTSGTVMGELKRVLRKSPTLGAKPPEGAMMLFDGTSAEGWNKGSLQDFEGRKALMSTNCETIETFDDHELHIEFRTPLIPPYRGQDRGNSGVYVQSRYEVQVLDSFGLEGEQNECGGIYSIRKPTVNMCFPPETWQTYDMKFTAAKYDAQGKKTQNARITVKHNGVVIHNDLELPHGTPGEHDEGAGPAPLLLQDHANPVLFRNIWAIKK